MTTISDVIRQAETALYDTQYPPTLKEKEILTSILHKAYTGTAVRFGEVRNGADPVFIFRSSRSEGFLTPDNREGGISRPSLSEDISGRSFTS